MADLTVQIIRDEVREYFDLEIDDLPDRMIDRWISEGWGKIVRYRPNWPGFESTVQLVVASGGILEYATPLKEIVSIETPQRTLVRMSHDQAQHRFARNGTVDPPGTPTCYSIHAGQLRFWPGDAVGGTYTIRGYRAATNPIDGATTDPIDLPHKDAGEMLMAWVVYRAAIRESELETAADYKDAFSQGMQLIAKDEVDSPAFTPIVLNSQPAYGVTVNDYLPDRLRMEGIDF